MVRRSVLAMLAVMAIVLGGVVVSTPAGAVVDSAVVVPSPNPSTIDNFLSSVSCVSVSFCVATGYQDSGSGYLTLVEQWDGTSWSTVTSPSPNPGTNGNVLFSVSCVSVSFCVATGIQYSGSSNQPLYETLVVSLTGPVPPTTTTTVAPEPVIPAFTG